MTLYHTIFLLMYVDVSIFLTIIVSFVFSEGRVTKPYLTFKVFGSIYLIVAYVLSHLQFYWKPSFLKCNEEHPVSENVSVKDQKYLEEKKHLCDLDSVWPYYWLYFTNWSFNLFTICVLLDTTLVVYRCIYTNEKCAWNKTM